MIADHNGRSVLSIRGRQRARTVYWNRYDKEHHSCRMCGSETNKLEVHHIDGDYLNNNILNLIALCSSCHNRVHTRKDTVKRLGQWKSKVEAMA